MSGKGTEAEQSRLRSVLSAAARTGSVDGAVAVLVEYPETCVCVRPWGESWR